MPRLLFFALLVVAVARLSAQNLTAPLLSGNWQSTYHNPAMVHFLPADVTVGLPGVANDLRLENVGYGDIFLRSGGNRVLSLSSWSTLAQDRNAVQDVYSIETLGLAVRTGALGLHAYHRLRVNGDADYPGALVDLIALGNAAFIGQTVDIAPRGDIASYHEIGIGLSYAINDRIALGGRVKYLAGVSAIDIADGGRLELTTGEENYTLTVDQDLTLRTVRAFDYRSLDDFDFVYEPSQLRPDGLFGSNYGVGIDLGLAVNFDRLRLNASVTDLGAGIDWDEGLTNLRFSGTTSFSGVDVLTDLLTDSISLDQTVDSLTAALEPSVVDGGFRTNISANFFVGAEFDVTDRLTAGALIALEERLGRTVPAVALVGRLAVLEWLRVGLNLNHRSGIRTNLGMHLLADLKGFQLFASSDKLLSLIDSGNSSVAGIRLGASLRLGHRRSSVSFRPEYR